MLGEKKLCTSQVSAWHALISNLSQAKLPRNRDLAPSTHQVAEGKPECLVSGRHPASHISPLKFADDTKLFRVAKS